MKVSYFLIIIFSFLLSCHKENKKIESIMIFYFKDKYILEIKNEGEGVIKKEKSKTKLFPYLDSLNNLYTIPNYTELQNILVKHAENELVRKTFQANEVNDIQLLSRKNFFLISPTNSYSLDMNKFVPNDFPTVDSIDFSNTHGSSLPLRKGHKYKYISSSSESNHYCHIKRPLLARGCSIEKLFITYYSPPYLGKGFMIDTIETLFLSKEEIQDFMKLNNIDTLRTKVIANY